MSGAVSGAGALGLDLEPRKIAEAVEKVAREQAEKREVVKLIGRYEPWLFGLFTPSPSWPPVLFTVDHLLYRGIPRCILLLLLASSLAISTVLLLCWLRFWSLPIALVPVAYGSYHKVTQIKKARSSYLISDQELKWHEHCREYFSTDTLPGRLRRHEVVEDVLRDVKAAHASQFNEHVRAATGLAVYGCGILAAAHVGGLRALEKHGMRYDNLKTLTGVSAGAVVVACVAVGYKAEELFELITALPFWRLAVPELGSILRLLGTVVQDVVGLCVGSDVAALLAPLAGRVGSGPGINSGKALYDMIGDALEAKCNDPNITLGEVKEKYNKRLVIIVCELDSGKERHLTPETDPYLPVRAAVRMSMGVPGLMEPFQYNGHAYCDGGMCNDFPMNALPNDGHRLGLMVRPVDWIEYHLGGLGRVAREDDQLREDLETFPTVRDYFGSWTTTKDGLFSVRSPINLALTSVTIMMDANLMLQIKQATARRGSLDEKSLSELAPEILTLSGGRLDPFDFNLNKEQHRDLYYSGQLCVHLHAARRDQGRGVMPQAGYVKSLLFCLHMDPPKH